MAAAKNLSIYSFIKSSLILHAIGVAPSRDYRILPGATSHIPILSVPSPNVHSAGAGTAPVSAGTRNGIEF
jgi:hypothetical protein